MITITLNAFSFLQPKLAAKRIGYSNTRLEVKERTVVRELIARCGLSESEVETIFLNGRVVSWDRELCNGDRVAFLPPGTPGPYRVMLGMTNPPQQSAHSGNQKKSR
jgi:molybdopterin converting factor small subunit